jgi:hypothetical protein
MSRPVNRFGITLVAAACLCGPIRPAWAAPAAAEMHDLAPEHWAFQAVEGLIERYGVMSGFPDNTFRGAKAVSRYELAASLYNLLRRLDGVKEGREGAGVPVASRGASASDKVLIERLKGEFRKELDSLTSRMAAAEKNNQDLKTTLERSAQIKGDISSLVADELLDVGKDRTAPYIGSLMNLTVRGVISDNTAFNASLGSAIKASGSGDVPSVLAGALGKTPADTNVTFRGARVTSTIGSTVINVGRFPLWLAGFGPGTDLNFYDSFIVGVGGLKPAASALRVGSDVGLTAETTLGALNVRGGVNSNIVIWQMEGKIGPVKLTGGYETDHKAITQALNSSDPRVKTTDNAAVVLEFGDEAPWGGTFQANLTNLALTSIGGGVRGGSKDFGASATVMYNSDPNQSVGVISYGAIVKLPGRALAGPWGIPRTLMAFTDHYTVLAPRRSDGRVTEGPGGQALGRNAGFTVQVPLDNPWVPNLIAEYNVQAKLIESIFIPKPSDPITSETFVIRSRVDF